MMAAWKAGRVVFRNPLDLASLDLAGADQRSPRHRAGEEDDGEEEEEEGLDHLRSLSPRAGAAGAAFHVGEGVEVYSASAGGFVEGIVVELVGGGEANVRYSVGGERREKLVAAAAPPSELRRRAGHGWAAGGAVIPLSLAAIPWGFTH
jgi:hypothetical protein